jgi:hypothetical protein
MFFDAVFDAGFLTTDFLKGKLTALVIEFLEAIEAVAGIPSLSFHQQIRLSLPSCELGHSNPCPEYESPLMLFSVLSHQSYRILLIDRVPRSRLQS